MTCNCMEDLKGPLAARNTEIEADIIFNSVDGLRPHIQTRQIEKGRGKTKATSIIAGYCPFCGTKYRGSEPKPEGGAS